MSVTPAEPESPRGRSPRVILSPGTPAEDAMEHDTRNLQNEFFNAARREKATVTVFLDNGKKLTGRLKSFDKFTLLLEGQQGEQIIFKHAISTVSSSQRPVEVSEDESHRGEVTQMADPAALRRD